MNRSPRPTSTYEITARTLGDRLLAIVRPIRILNAIHWDRAVEHRFFARGGREQPVVSYRPLAFDPATKRRELRDLEREVLVRLGAGDPVGLLLSRRCRAARAAVDLLAARGTRAFAQLSGEIYGRPTPAEDATVDAVFTALAAAPSPSLATDRTIDAATAVESLADRLGCCFAGVGRFRVQVSDRVQADAAACGRTIKLRREARFSPADIAALEVHEGWAHIGTTLNAHRQPVCAFLAQGLPAGTVAQEGLAVLCELLAGVCHAGRVRRLHRRYQAVQMADAGADFRDIYQFFLGDADAPHEAFQQAARIFRGSLAAGAGPFAKDRTYALGLVRLLRIAHAAHRAGRLRRLQNLFAGKMTFADLPIVESLAEAGLVAPPMFLPPPFDDGAILADRLHRLPHPPHRLPAPSGSKKSLQQPGNEPTRPISFQEGIGYEWPGTD